MGAPVLGCGPNDPWILELETGSSFQVFGHQGAKSGNSEVLQEGTFSTVHVCEMPSGQNLLLVVNRGLGRPSQNPSLTPPFVMRQPHPRSDGRTDRQVEDIEGYLRKQCHDYQVDVVSFEAMSFSEQLCSVACPFTCLRFWVTELLLGSCCGLADVADVVECVSFHDCRFGRIGCRSVPSRTVPLSAIAPHRKRKMS